MGLRAASGRRRDAGQVQGPAQGALEGQRSVRLVDHPSPWILLDHLGQGISGRAGPEDDRQRGLSVASRHEERSRKATLEAPVEHEDSGPRLGAEGIQE